MANGNRPIVPIPDNEHQKEESTRGKHDEENAIRIILCLTMVIALLPTTVFAAMPNIMGVTLTGDVLSWNAVPGATRCSVNVGSGGCFAPGYSVTVGSVENGRLLFLPSLPARGQL